MEIRFRPRHITSSQCQRKARICAALRVALEQEPHHLLDEQRDAARSLAHSIDHLLGERMPACYPKTMRRTCARSSGASETTQWCEHMAQGARNSGRVVALAISFGQQVGDPAAGNSCPSGHA